MQNKKTTESSVRSFYYVYCRSLPARRLSHRWRFQEWIGIYLSLFEKILALDEGEINVRWKVESGGEKNKTPFIYFHAVLLSNDMCRSLLSQGQDEGTARRDLQDCQQHQRALPASGRSSKGTARAWFGWP